MRRVLSIVLASCLFAPAAGCMQGTLATRTGPAGPTRWSTDKQQWAHVGEPVEFQFLVLRPGTSQPIANAADYAVWELGSQPRVTQADPDGRFRCTHAFSEVTAVAPEDLLVKVTAYRKRQAQDVIVIGDELVYAANPNDLPDARVASDDLRLRVYQARVRFDIAPLPTPLLWQTAVMILERGPGRTTTIRPHRPGRAGFTVLRGDGRQHTFVTYEPTGDQISPCGTTKVTLRVRDEQGQEQVYQQLVDTP